MSEKKYFCFFTDGATEPTNPGPSGYAFVETKGYNNKQILNSGSSYIGFKTNNIAEISAIEAVFDFILGNDSRYLGSYNAVIDIYSDSQYAISCITEWYDKWVKTYKLSDKKNIGLISSTVHKYKKIKEIVEVNIKWVKGHNGNFGNEMCDELASLAILHKKGFIKPIEYNSEKGIITIEERIEYLLSIHNEKDNYESESIRILIDFYKNSVL